MEIHELAGSSTLSRSHLIYVVTGKSIFLTTASFEDWYIESSFLLGASDTLLTNVMIMIS